MELCEEMRNADNGDYDWMADLPTTDEAKAAMAKLMANFPHFIPMLVFGCKVEPPCNYTELANKMSLHSNPVCVMMRSAITNEYGEDWVHSGDQSASVAPQPR